MKRSEYMSKLSEALEIFGEDVKSEILEDYEEHYEIALQNGKSEEQISDELGEIEELIKELKKSESVIGCGYATSKKDSECKENTYQSTDPNQTNDWNQSNDTNVMNDSNQSNDMNLMNDKNQFNDTYQTWANETKDNNFPRKVEVRSKFAHVEVVSSDDNQIHLDWVNYNESKARDYYEFWSWVEGTTIYGGLSKKSLSSIFSVVFAQDIKIVVKIPKGFPEVEIISMSGDTVIQDVEVESVKVNSASGDINVEHCISSQMSLDTKSGEIICKQSKQSNLYMDTKSSDIVFCDIQSTSIHTRSLSGDISGINFSGDTNVRTASGDIKVTNAFGKQFDISSISGEVKVGRLQGETMRIATKSGDIEAEFFVESCIASSISGDIELTNARESSLQTSSVSGDIEITCNGIGGYVADIHTISGMGTLRFGDRTEKNRGKGVFTYGTGTTKIKAKTTSGNIRIRG